KKPLSSNSLEQQILTLERQRRELLEVNKQWDHQFRSMKQLYEKQVTMLTTSVAICVPPHLCVFASQKDTEVLSEALHEMKEENRLLKQKNASMTRKKEHYESEISRLNKLGKQAGTHFSSALCMLPFCSGGALQGEKWRKYLVSPIKSLCMSCLSPLTSSLPEQKGNGTEILLYAPSVRLWLKGKVTQLKNSFYMYSVFENDDFSSEDMILFFILIHKHIYTSNILCIYVSLRKLSLNSYMGFFFNRGKVINVIFFHQKIT
uniref:TNFAIP3 interacting protein 3 n=1 Tax=Catharus ustulatus TaxID=91951 RepID=A0A8C3VJL1_CATUS